MSPHWKEEELSALDSCSSFAEAAQIAIGVLARMKELGKPIVEICGPISTGGLGSIEANSARFRAAIQAAHENGLTVFDNMPFERVIIRISNHRLGGAYDTDILEVFYRRLFESGHFSKALFLPGWETSHGATWERKMLQELGVEIEDYPVEWLPSA